MEPGFQIYETPKSSGSFLFERTNDLVMAMVISILFIALGVTKFGAFWSINY